jgi:hypothetical protein
MLTIGISVSTIANEAKLLSNESLAAAKSRKRSCCMKMSRDAMTKNETAKPSFPLSPVVFTATPASAAPKAINPAVFNRCWIVVAQGVCGEGIVVCVIVPFSLMHLSKHRILH